MLNPSQKEAMDAALKRKLTIIQGPPGTGKTHTAVATLAHLAREGRGPILATAESNVAVDNLLEGLLEAGIRAVRTGRPVKVRESLRQATLDAQLEQHESVCNTQDVHVRPHLHLVFTEEDAQHVMATSGHRLRR